MTRRRRQISPRLGTRLRFVQQGKGLGGNGRQVIARQRAVITGNHLMADPFSQSAGNQLPFGLYSAPLYPFG